MNELKWADGIDFGNVPESSHVSDDISLLKTAAVGTLVVSIKTGRVAPITEEKRSHVKVFGIWFRRDGEEKGRRNGHVASQRIVGLTTRSRDEIVFRHWPELKVI